MSREYPRRPIVGIGVAVLRPGGVLLVRRGTPPAVGSWSLPGGGQELGETTEQAARRELEEETGLAVGPLHLAAVVDSIVPDASGQLRFHYTIIDYAALWQGDSARPGGDITACVWAGFDDLARFRLWHEAHRVIAVGCGLLGLVPPCDAGVPSADQESRT
jgi:ADP-ribose pyrophosphatase YjhB (NUDIX family)